MDFQESKELGKETRQVNCLGLTVSVFFALLSFFIVLNVIATSNKDKAEKLTNSIKSEFKNKDLKQELNLFGNEGFGRESGKYEQSFRQVLNGFMGPIQGSMDFQYSENPSNYIIKINNTSVFGSDDQEIRSPAANFINYLNKYIGNIKKHADASVKLVIPYDPENKKDIQIAKEKIKNLHDTLDRNIAKSISFSIIPIEIKSSYDKDKLKNTYLYFSRNEF